jgi:hypothetical protein
MTPKNTHSVIRQMTKQPFKLLKPANEQNYMKIQNAHDLKICALYT